MPDSDQVFIFNKEELSLIKNTFAGNDTLLYTIRKVFLQFPLTEVEKGLIRVGVTPEVLRVLKKRILPELSPEYPLGQIPSILVTLSQHLNIKNEEEMAPHFEAKQLEIDYLTERFEELEDIMLERERDVVSLKLADMAKMDYVNMTAYLFLLGYIDPMLNMIKAIAGEKEETPEEQEKRLFRDSSK